MHERSLRLWLRTILIFSAAKIEWNFQSRQIFSAGYSTRLYMYLSIYNRYSVVASQFPVKDNTALPDFPNFYGVFRYCEHRAWSGFAFERVCLQHIAQIKEALGISGVLSNVYSWRTEADEDKGIDKTQIDLLIDRNDGVINLCEMKFSEQEYAITEDEEMKLRRRRGNFIEATQTKKAVHITLVTPYGLKKNSHSSIAQNEINLRDCLKISAK